MLLDELVERRLKQKEDVSGARAAYNAFQAWEALLG